MIYKKNMVDLLKKYRIELLILGILTVLFFVLRLPNLVSQPIFADEAIYIRWAQVMKAEPTLRFLPLSDGKTPLFMWIMIPFFKVFQNPLYAGRFLSVLAGFGSFLGILFLGWKFFNPKVALWSVFLLTVTPFFVFFDRMALVDSMLAMFSIWSLFLAMLLIKYQRLDIAMFLGFALGGGILTKTPGMFNLLALPVSLISFDWKGKNRQTRFIKTFGLLLLALGIGFVMYNLLRLGPGFTSLSSRNQDYIFAPNELVGRPLDPFIPHFHDISDWLPKLLTIPVLLLTILGIVLSIIKRNKYALTILF
ncbi:MAG: glycosyltransferase family 39 protein, partial [Candidatus Daviesbacteria bacterium]|nr:glycosyltransferase family 39 protein [Candidatus Daviesbacteria bacterium]